MLTALSRPQSGRLRIEWERLDAPRCQVRLACSGSRSVATIRAALATRVARRLDLSGAGELEVLRAFDQLNREFDRAVRSGWI